jgi:hypothetical protein
MKNLSLDGEPHRIDRVLSFSPVVRIGTPPPSHTQASVCFPLWLAGGGGAHSLAGEGVCGIPNRTTGEKLSMHFIYSVYEGTDTVGTLGIYGTMYFVMSFQPGWEGREGREGAGGGKGAGPSRHLLAVGWRGPPAAFVL